MGRIVYRIHISKKFGGLAARKNDFQCWPEPTLPDELVNLIFLNCKINL